MDAEAWSRELKASGFAGEHTKRFLQIINGITHGVAIDFSGEREVNRTAANIPIDEGDVPKVSGVINTDCAKKKKAGPFDEQPFEFFTVSPIGAVPKKSGKIRVIHHLSYPRGGDSVNDSVEEEELRLSSFGHAARAVVKLGRGCFLIKLDVEAAYKQVPVRPEDWPLLGFKWEGKWYYERVLPFGLRSSCRIWEWYAAALHHLFEKIGVDVVIHYIDDFLFVVRSRDDAAQFLSGTLALTQRLGIPMAPDKTEGPTTCLTFLGIELDTIKMEARLPMTKLHDIELLTSVWLEKSSASVKELQSIAGVLRFAACVVRPGRFFCRSLFALIAALTKEGGGREKKYAISAAVRRDIAWWRSAVVGWNGISILYEQEWTDSITIEFFTDACLSGFGALFGNEWFEGRWRPEHLAAAQRGEKESMPFLELYAVVTAAATWGADGRWKGKKITFRSDCMPAVHSLAKGSSPQPHLMFLLRHLALSAMAGQYDFRCVHIAGVENVVADVLSRDGDCPQFRALCPNAAATPTKFCVIPLPRPEEL